MRNAPLMTTLARLLAEPGVREVLELRAPVGFLALHGGNQDRVTDEIALAAADRAGVQLGCPPRVRGLGPKASPEDVGALVDVLAHAAADWDSELSSSRPARRATRA